MKKHQSLQSIAILAFFGHVACGQVLQVRLETSSETGTPIESVIVGEKFFLSGFVEDIRDSPQGIFSVYTDVKFNGDLVTASVDGLEFGESFQVSPRGAILDAEIDEVGGIVSGAITTPPLANEPGSDSELELFRASFVATAPGTAQFQSEMADVLPRNATTLIGINEALSSSDFRFGDTSLQIVPEPSGQVVGVSAIAILFFVRRKRK